MLRTQWNDAFVRFVYACDVVYPYNQNNGQFPFLLLFSVWPTRLLIRDSIFSSNQYAKAFPQVRWNITSPLCCNLLPPSWVTRGKYCISVWTYSDKSNLRRPYRLQYYGGKSQYVALGPLGSRPGGRAPSRLYNSCGLFLRYVYIDMYWNLV